jgi:hypothetical protein
VSKIQQLLDIKINDVSASLSEDDFLDFVAQIDTKFDEIDNRLNSIDSMEALVWKLNQT